MAPMPTEHTIGAISAHDDADVGQLDIANARIVDTAHIYETCEKLNKKAADSLKQKPWWHFGLW